MERMKLYQEGFNHWVIEHEPSRHRCTGNSRHMALRNLADVIEGLVEK